MAMNYAKYPIGSVAAITTAIKTAVEATGRYDSVEISSSTVTIKNNDVTYASLGVSGTAGVGIYSSYGASYGLGAQNTSFCVVGNCGHNAFVTFGGVNAYTFIFTKSKNNLPIITFTGYTGSQSRTDTYQVGSMPSDAPYSNATVVSTRGVPWIHVDTYASLANIIGPSSTETYSVADGGYVFDNKPSIIPSPWDANAITNLYEFMMDGYNCVTDGYFVIRDNA